MVETLEEDGTQMVGTGTGDSLNRSNTLLGDGWRVGAEDELGGGASELGKTSDVEVFVIDGLVCDQVGLGFFDGREDVWLAVVITVCTNTEVDLLVVGVGLVGSGQLEDTALRKSNCGTRHVSDCSNVVNDAMNR